MLFTSRLGKPSRNHRDQRRRYRVVFVDSGNIVVQRLFDNGAATGKYQDS